MEHQYYNYRQIYKNIVFANIKQIQYETSVTLKINNTPNLRV